ncbi:MAG: SLAP domain-containing protein [Lactobacillus crispatus]|jgi:hypothetical protein|nr:SLAP domain-containing protein [Lactobacillus crispatus]MCI1334927.1 SLAP domain-containing protein [Lactobacillus crispatus]MCI1365611.1 SLAP domain-containing protein [Lactobacillus crispatus]MCI1493301.1 SLAP domain-containing protein [Lactobacillus crispatus]MCI1523799.1 SLAP domain-containing protein [Lactobacillus crispatus]
MRLSHKLVMVSAAVLMGVSPVVGMAGNVAPVQAVTKSASGVHNTYGKNSKVKVTKTMKFVDRNGKKTSKTAPKGGSYTIWNVKDIDGQVYYSIQTDLKYWIPAAATEGTVTYKSGNTTYTLKSNGKKVTTSTATTKKTSDKQSTKKVAKKATKKESAKTTSKKSSSKKASTKKTSSKKTPVSKAVKITTKNKAYVYDKNGKRVKNYLGLKQIGKNVTVKGLGTKTIKGVKYYALQPNHYYIKASDVTVK